MLGPNIVFVSTLTPNEEVATNNKHHSNGSQHESSTVSIVFVTHKADPTHRVSVHLCSVEHA